MRILYVCHDLDYWMAHRAGLARAMVDRGDGVALLSGVPPGTGGGADSATLARHGLEPGVLANPGLMPLPQAGGVLPGGRLWCFPMQRQRLQAGRDIALGRAVRRAARAFRPDVVHLLTLKPILFGGAALRLRSAAGPRVIATFPGLGRVFAADPPDPRQRLILGGLGFALGTPRTTAAFENEADRARLVAAGVIPHARSAVIHGAGFDPAEFPALPLPPGPAGGAPLDCLFASRMLRAKGGEAVVAAARLLKAEGAPVRVTLAGPTGGDPDAVPQAQLQAWQAEGLIRHLGPVAPAAMPALIAAHHVLLLPTRYPEGTPRILAEAGAVGRPAITSAHPGCAAFIRDGIEGLVIDPPDGPALATAIRRLLAEPGLLARLAAAAQARALQGGFTTQAVAAAYRALYEG